MDPTTQQHIASYRGILDQADTLIARWFAAAQTAPAPPEAASLSTMLLTLRRAIDTRHKLDTWEHPPTKSPRKGAHTTALNECHPEERTGLGRKFNDSHTVESRTDDKLEAGTLRAGFADSPPPESRRDAIIVAPDVSPRVQHSPHNAESRRDGTKPAHPTTRNPSTTQPTTLAITASAPILPEDLANPLRDSSPSSTILSRTAKRPKPISEKESAAMLRQVNSLLDRVDRTLKHSRPPPRRP